MPSSVVTLAPSPSTPTLTLAELVCHETLACTVVDDPDFALDRRDVESPTPLSMQQSGLLNLMKILMFTLQSQLHLSVHEQTVAWEFFDGCVSSGIFARILSAWQYAILHRPGRGKCDNEELVMWFTLVLTLLHASSTTQTATPMLEFKTQLELLSTQWQLPLPYLQRCKVVVLDCLDAQPLF